MKTTLTYEITEDDNEDKLLRILNADNAYGALYEIQMYFRNQYKYGEHNIIVESFIEEARGKKLARATQTITST